jgi:hypothetical protein
MEPAGSGHTQNIDVARIYTEGVARPVGDDGRYSYGEYGVIGC